MVHFWSIALRWVKAHYRGFKTHLRALGLPWFLMLNRHFPCLPQCNDGRFSKPSGAHACAVGPIALTRAPAVQEHRGSQGIHLSCGFSGEVGPKFCTGETSTQHLALITWQECLEKVALSLLPFHPSGMVSAGQTVSSSEDTSSSSDETYVEVTATHPQELPSANL